MYHTTTTTTTSCLALSLEVSLARVIIADTEHQAALHRHSRLNFCKQTVSLHLHGRGTLCSWQPTTQDHPFRSPKRFSDGVLIPCYVEGLRTHNQRKRRSLAFMNSASTTTTRRKRHHGQPPPANSEAYNRSAINAAIAITISQALDSRVYHPQTQIIQ